MSRLYWNGAARTAPPGWIQLRTPSAESLISDGIAITSGSVDLAYLGPAINRVPLWQMVSVLEEFRRVLRPGGWLRVAFYDFMEVIAAYERGDTDYLWWSDWRHPSGRLADQLLESGRVRSLVTPDLVRELLLDAGFEPASIAAVGESGSGEEALSEPDTLVRQCSFVEAAAPERASPGVFGHEPSAIHLSLVGSEVAVTWCAPPGSAGLLRVRRVGTADWHSVPATPRATIDGDLAPYVFSASCGPLNPSIDYEYVIEQTQDGTFTGTVPMVFRAPAGAGDAISLAFIADTGLIGRTDGLAEGTERIIQELCREAPSIILGGGDYAYRSSDPRCRSTGEAARSWIDQMAPIATSRPMMIQLGNHEVALGERYRGWADHLVHFEGSGLPSFSFEAGPCHVVGLFVPTSEVRADTAAWLEADLADARARRVPWLIVFQHQPLFAHGSAHPSDDRVRVALGRTLERHRVDLHLSAHDQSYERTFPLRASHACPVVCSSSLSRYPQGQGVVYAKVSPSGKRSDRGRSFSRLPNVLPEYIACADDTRHHWALINADSAALSVQTLGFAAADAPLDVVDHFTIVRDDSGRVA